MLKGYTRFQPCGPNFLRSTTTAWKRHSAKVMLLSSPGLADDSKKSSENGSQFLRTLAPSPSGGSLVSFTHTCRMLIGSFEASAERNIRNSTCAVSRSSHRFSRYPPVQRGVKWMFCRNAHPPFLYETSIAFSATGSWPWPRDTRPKLPWSNPNPSTFPSFSVSFTGSTPAERMKKTGVCGVTSPYDLSRLNACDVTYCPPITVRTNDESASDMRSVRSERISTTRSNSGSFFQSPGSGDSSGRSSSNHSRKRLAEPTRSSGSFSKGS
mmetsp:Transcript_48479/g.115336  ORF Transcript_48479/g.115336 Transcript_48479/m.115336 type:complete len:268 (-) Transcript_48479:5891-6694(-)